MTDNNDKEKTPLKEDQNSVASENQQNEADNQIEHCHDTMRLDNKIDKKARRKLIIASVLCLFFMIAECVGGGIASSLAIMTDAAHLLTDFASFMISLFAIYMASRPPTKRMSFGWHRAEVVGALVSVLLIWVVTGILFALAVKRVRTGNFEIEPKAMLITSVIGILVNLIMAATLHQHTHSHNTVGEKTVETVEENEAENPANHAHSHQQNDTEAANDKNAKKHNHSHEEDGGKENINVRAAFIHVIGDFIQSLGVFVAALIIYIDPKLKMADPICTFIFAVLVLFTTLTIIRDTMLVLMEGTPKELDYNLVKKRMLTVEGVSNVHNLRIWSLTMNKAALSAHIIVDAKTAKEAALIIQKTSQMLRDRYEIADVTLQPEITESNTATDNCIGCADPND